MVAASGAIAENAELITDSVAMIFTFLFANWHFAIMVVQKLHFMFQIERSSLTVTTIAQDDFFKEMDSVRRIWKEGDPSVLFYDYDSAQAVSFKRSL
jgi:hypothetical protein